jgi:prophage regulatory protein
MSRLVRIRDLSKDIGLSRWTILRMEAAGKFPKRIPLTSHAFAYDADEVSEWMEERKAARQVHESRAGA